MKRLLTYGLVAAILSLVACRESETVYIYPPSAMEDAQDFVNKFGPQKQSFKMSTSELPKTLTLSDGTLVTIPTSAIRKNGNYITGNFTVEILEMLKRSDYILGGINTNYTTGYPMHMDGILQVDILANDQFVDPVLGNVMDVRIPTVQGGNHVKITYADINYNGTGFTAWGPDMADVFSDVDQVAFSTLQIGWMSSGVFFRNDLPKGDLTVEVNGNPGDLATSRGRQGYTFVYFCPKGSKVAMQLHDEIGPDRVRANPNTIPVGVEGKVIAFSIKDRKFYYSEANLSTSTNSYVILDMDEVPVNELLTSIRELDSY